MRSFENIRVNPSLSQNKSVDVLSLHSRLNAQSEKPLTKQLQVIDDGSSMDKFIVRKNEFLTAETCYGIM